MPDPASRQLHFDAAERGFIYAVGRRYVDSAAAADDVAQEAMLLAYRHRDAFRGDSHPRTWLYRIAMTTAIGYLRRQRRAAEVVRACDPHVLAAIGAAASDASPAEQLSARELAHDLAGALATLDDKYAAIVERRADEMCDREIAGELGLTIATVKVRAHRARAMLRAALADRPRYKLAAKSASSRMLAQQVA